MDDRTLSRFLAKVERLENGCWIWTASQNRTGYGHFRDGSRIRYAHRVSYEHHVGPIPDASPLTTCVGFVPA